MCVAVTVCLSKVDYGQADMRYIDSVRGYVKFVDSIIIEGSINPSSGTNIGKTLTHFTGVDKSIQCGQAELYKDSVLNNLYRLSYSDRCDTAFKLQDYYFYKNKIVFVRTVKTLNGKDVSDQYYLNDELVNAATGELYLQEGYEVLKKVVH